MSSTHGVRVGSMRPSQLMWSYGIGAMIDLPRLSVMVEGLDFWSTEHARIISEDRLLGAVRSSLGPQVKRLLEPPLPEEEPFGADIGDPVYRIGVPVGVFPKWLRCPRCGLLSDVDSGVFKFKGSSKRPDEVQYLHEGCSKGKNRAPTCVPARFLAACRAGHLDDFPWREFVHRGPTTCQGTLRFYEKGSSLETANLFVACDLGTGFSKQIEGEVEHPGAASGGCGQRPRSMVDAFGPGAKSALPLCRGRHPHLRDSTDECGRELKTILLGSSSSWFPQAISALSIPTGSTELAQAVEDNWSNLGEVTSVAEVAFLRKINQLRSATKFSDEEIFAAVNARSESGGGDRRHRGHEDPRVGGLVRSRVGPERRGLPRHPRSQARRIRAVLRTDRARREDPRGERTDRLHPARSAGGTPPRRRRHHLRAAVQEPARVGARQRGAGRGNPSQVPAGCPRRVGATQGASRLTCVNSSLRTRAGVPRANSKPTAATRVIATS